MMQAQERASRFLGPSPHPVESRDATGGAVFLVLTPGANACFGETRRIHASPKAAPKERKTSSWNTHSIAFCRLMSSTARPTQVNTTLFYMTCDERRLTWIKRRHGKNSIRCALTLLVAAKSARGSYIGGVRAHLPLPSGMWRFPRLFGQ